MGKTMSKFGAICPLIVIGIMLIINVPAFGQEADNGKRPNPMEKGSWSLLFQVDQNFRLTSFEGMTISCKRHYSPISAVRLGLSISANNTDQESKSIPSAEVPTRSTLHGRSYYSVSAEFLKLGYPLRNSAVNLYYGFGPDVSYRFQRSEDELGEGFPEDQIGLKRFNESRIWSVGLAGILGVEWFPAKHIGLMAEYGMLAYYQNESNENSNYEGSKNISDEDSFVLSNRAVKLSLAVYF